jgi:uncharacterized protein
MKCPIDGADLVMSERQGVEIDYCPQCRGVWLDRGELDKIIERSLTQQPAAAPAPPPPSYEREQPRRDRYESYQQQPYRKKRKESWLSEIFD